MKITYSFGQFIQISLLLALAHSQHPEINDQYETHTLFTSTVIENETSSSGIDAVEISAKTNPELKSQPSSTTETVAEPTTEKDVTVKSTGTSANQTTRRNLTFAKQKQNCFVKIYESISASLDAFITTPKINTVLKNIGVCIVNGLMEIITFYVPAPFIPLIASAAGMIIPFEPVVMLREKLPMKNYRRALNSAVNSFLGTFDRFQVHDDDDPYMTRRFNRRFMGNSNEELSTKRNGIYED